jgi:hypothetical protein
MITVLFLVIIMSILGLSMVVSVNSDMMINGYYGNSRAAYYAADSGINIARQYLSNQLQTQVNKTACLGWGSNAVAGCTSDPLTTTTATSTALSSLKSAYSSFSSGVLNTNSASGSWPSYFMVQDSTNCTNSIANASGSPVITQNTVNGVVLNTEYKYTFNYVICSTGTGASGGSSTTTSQQTSVKEAGVLLIDIKATDYPPPTFAGYGQFVSNQNSCPGSYLTPGVYTGPSFTNGAWTLGSTSTPYTFTNTLSSVNADIYYYNSSGRCSGTTTVPISGISATFQGGVKLGATAITPPSDSYSQQWAVLDGKGYGEGSAPTNATFNAYLKDITGTAYPTGGASSGVYLPYFSNNGTATFGYLGSDGVTVEASGGIYVQGNASVVLAATTDSSGNATETYTITQGSTVTTIVTNPTTNTTKFTSGGTTKTLVGIPENLASNPGSQSPGTMLYVNGTITGLSGPASPSDSNKNSDEYTAAAIQNNAMVTVAGAGDINITGNILYATEPVTKTTADTLLLSQGTSSSNQVLGVFTANGSIILNSPYSDQNLETDGTLAAIGSTTACGTSTCGFKTSDTINTWTNVGGQIQSNEFVCSITAANTYYDQRFSAWSNFFPPWFPSTSTSGTYKAYAPTVTPTQQRTSWSWVSH